MIRSLAYLDDRRQLCLIDAAGRPGLDLRGLRWASWQEAHDEEVHSWPTWSPDGSRVASFRMLPRPPKGMTIVVQVTESNGAHVVELGEIPDRLPSYLQWSPRGDALSVLTQDGEQLHLDRYDTWRGGSKSVVEASPLFFDGLADGRLAVFAGEPGQIPRVRLYGHLEPTELPGLPGNFCAPIVLGDRVAYVTVDAGMPELRIATLDGASHEVLRRFDGLAALVPSADRHELALSIARDGTGEVYHGVETFNLVTGARTVITDQPLTAFYAIPDGSGWVTANRTRMGTVMWSRLGRDGVSRPLCEALPTRDMRFHLRFFEQFAASHPLVDAASERLVVAGGILGADDPRGTPRIWSVPLAGGAPEALAFGVFATFAPPALA